MFLIKTKIDTPVTFISAGQFAAKDFWIHTERSIDSYEIVFGIDGTTFLQQDDNKYEIGPGDVLLLHPYHTHKGYMMSKPGTSFYWIHFSIQNTNESDSTEDILKEVVQTANNPYYSGLSSYAVIPEYFSSPDASKINILICQLLHISKSRYYTTYGADFILTLLLIELSQQFIVLNRSPLKVKNADRIITEIIEWIRINCLEEISLSQIVHKYGLCSDYISRLFKKEMGMHIKEYINLVRIEKAKTLLIQTNNSIKEISYLAGFQDEKYFMKIFKKIQRLTPSEFRNSYYLTHLNNQ